MAYTLPLVSGQASASWTGAAAEQGPRGAPAGRV